MSKLLEQINIEKKLISIGELCTNIFSGGTPSTTNSNFWNGGISWLSSGETRNDFVNTTEKTITREGVDNSSTKLALKNDVVIATAGQGLTRGQVSFLNIDTYINQSLISFRTDPNKLDSRYLYYNLKSRYTELRSLSDDTSSRGSITIPILSRMQIGACSLPTQKKIAGILSAYDAKIENNNKIIKNLETTAQTIFNEWFVNFRFPGYEKAKFVESEMGETPDGWEVKTLDGVAEFLNGVASQKYPAENTQDSLPVIKIREMNSGVDKNSDRATKNIDSKYVIKNGDILFSWSGSLELMLWVGGNGVLNQHIFKVTSEKYPQWFVYQWVKRHLQNFRTIAEGKATTMGHIQRHHLSESFVVVPDKIILGKADRILSSTLSQQLLLEIENRSLKESRDQLLAKLI